MSIFTIRSWNTTLDRAATPLQVRGGTHAQTSLIDHAIPGLMSEQASIVGSDRSASRIR